VRRGPLRAVALNVDQIPRWERQGVEVGTYQDSWAGAILENADDAVPADFAGHLVSNGLEFLGEPSRGLLFLVRQLGVLVKLFVGRNQLRQL
jgi:hypothetical protein